MMTETQVINRDLNKTLIHFQDMYEKLKASKSIPAKNPFEENPFAGVEGLEGIAREVHAKAYFLSKH